MVRKGIVVIKLEKKNFEIFEIENFRKFFVNPCRGQPGNGKARRNNFFNNF